MQTACFKMFKPSTNWFSWRVPGMTLYELLGLKHFLALSTQQAMPGGRMND